MHPNDAVIAILTPESPFNPNGRVFRSLDVIQSFLKMSRGEVLGLLAGDLANQVLCRPSKKKPGQIMVALRQNIVEKAEKAVQVGGPNIAKVALVPMGAEVVHLAPVAMVDGGEDLGVEQEIEEDADLDDDGM